MASKRRLEMTPSRPDQDPDYEVITVPTAAKRQRVQEEDVKEQTVRRMQIVIKKQFNIALQDKEKEIELVDERLQKARMQLDKLRACIVARYYGKAGLQTTSGEKSKQKLDLSHPAIQRALGHPSRSSSPPAPSHSNFGEGQTSLSRPSSRGEGPLIPESGDSTPIAELLGLSDAFLDSERCSPVPAMKGPRNTGQDTFGVGPPLDNLKPPVSQADSEEGSRFHVKKRIIVGNVSKYIPPGHREDSDPSTHKWMVYVRGPPQEPRIHHFVEKVWFFLHPSYRPNDLLEVKEPPFHLTRRGWGEFPIRVQLHFRDPRNKKVDIIHQLKLDRTYTGLQTLGAETIVDVELDRYLFNESGDPLSRPSTPTVTKVNYKEGLKPDLSRVPTPIRSTISLPNDDSQRRSITSPSPLLLESLGGRTPESTPDRSRPPSRGSSVSSPLVKVLPGEGSALSNRATPISVSSDSSFDKTREDLVSDMSSSAAVSLGKLSSRVKAQSGPALLATAKPPRTMPPLGPISTSLNKTPGMESNKTTQVSPTSVNTTSFASSLLLSASEASNNVGQLATDTPQVSPTQSGAINVGDVAISSLGSKLIRIQDGQIVQETSSEAVSPTQVKAENKVVVTLNQSMPGAKTNVKMTQIAKPAVTSTATISLQRIPVASLAGRPQTIVSASSPSVQNAVSVPQLTKQTLMGSPMVRKSPAGVTIVQQAQVGATPARMQQQQSILPVMSNPPAGTQYYVTAKSTDKNLQGKVILIPQQVFSQSAGQAGGKSGRGAGQGQSKQGSGSFLSPSNVLILPQGSIVPPLPPGSIVQIQPVPNPTRPSPQPSTSAQQQMTRIALTQKSGASTIISPKPATQRVAAGGVIQIQRSAGQTLAKLVPAALGANTQQAMVSSNMSLLPEMKGQLARTPAGGVVLVQRTQSAAKGSAVQTVSGIQNVVSSQGAPVTQKITLNPIAGGVVTQQKVSLPIKGGTSVLMSQPSKVALSKTVVLQSQASSISSNSTKTIQVRTGQPTVKTIAKFVPPLDDVKGQGSRVTEKPENRTSVGDVETQKQTGGVGLLNANNDGVDHASIAGESRDESRVSGIGGCGDGLQQGGLSPTDNGESKEPTSHKSIVTQEGDVQSAETMQVNVSEIGCDIVISDSSVVVISKDNAANAPGSQSSLKEKRGELGKMNSCDIKIKQEVILDAEEAMEVEVGMNENANSVNGHVLLPNSISAKQSGGGFVKANGIGDKCQTSNGDVICEKTALSVSPIASHALSAENKCVIKVVNAKLQKPACSSTDTGKAGGGKLRFIRIKQEPGMEHILATLATAPLLGLEEGGMKVGVDGGKERNKEEEEMEGWESREMKRWLRILGEEKEEETNLYGVTSIDQLVKYVAEQAPLIDPTRVQNELPFCATSLEHYHSWSLPKRRAMEWQRAVFMRNKVIRLKSKVQCLRKVPMWSKKKIVVWCRRHGFTPPEPGARTLPTGKCVFCGVVKCPGTVKTAGKQGQKTGCLRNYLSQTGVLQHTTFSIPDELTQRLTKLQSMRRGCTNADDIEIDIIALGDPSQSLKVKTEGEEVQQLKCFMPPSEGARYVTETAEKIGVHFKPVQVGEDTYSPVIQEMIYAATRQFLSDALRSALAKSFGDREDLRLPDEILPSHVHQAVASIPPFDFLTNSHIGVSARTTDEQKDSD